MTKLTAHITDTHLDDKTALDRGGYPRKNLDDILSNIKLHDVNEIVFTGDIGEKPTYSSLFEKFENTELPYKAILGNHDDHSEAIKHLKHITSENESELYYSDEDDLYKYLYLDSSASVVSDAQLNWLKNEINTQKPIVVFIHHPVLGLNTGMDTMYPLGDRDKVKAILQECTKGVTIFCGHYHMPDDRQEGNIRQYITPSVAFQVKKDSQAIEINVDSFGYRLISFGKEGISTKLVINRNGNFSTHKG